MKKAAFIKLWCDIVAAGRKVNHPEIRPSEAAFERLDDMKSAATQWRKHPQFRTLTEEQVREILGGKQP